MTGFQSKRAATRDLLTYKYPRTLQEAFPEDKITCVQPELSTEKLDKKSWWSKFQHDCLMLCLAVGWFAFACGMAGYVWYRSVP